MGLDFGKTGYADPVSGEAPLQCSTSSMPTASPEYLQAGIERMAAQLSADKERHKDFHRRRLINEEDGVDYINEKNRR